MFEAPELFLHWLAWKLRLKPCSEKAYAGRDIMYSWWLVTSFINEYPGHWKIADAWRVALPPCVNFTTCLLSRRTAVQLLMIGSKISKWGYGSKYHMPLILKLNVRCWSRWWSTSSSDSLRNNCAVFSWRVNRQWSCRIVSYEATHRQPLVSRVSIDLEVRLLITY